MKSDVAIMDVRADSVVVLDFETTGLSPLQGERAIEIGAVKLEGGQIVDRFQALMNPGQPVSAFITEYTGISNEMLAQAKPNADVMRDFASFIQDSHLVAHNASFDKKFLDAELMRIDSSYNGEFSCSLLLSRRILQSAPNHRLGTLVNYLDIPSTGSFHRALYDAEMTAKLWMAMIEDICQQVQQSSIPFYFVQKLTKTSKRNIAQVLASYR